MTPRDPFPKTGNHMTEDGRVPADEPEDDPEDDWDDDDAERFITRRKQWKN